MCIEQNNINYDNNFADEKLENISNEEATKIMHSQLGNASEVQCDHYPLSIIHFLLSFWGAIWSLSIIHAAYFTQFKAIAH